MLASKCSPIEIWMVSTCSVHILVVVNSDFMTSLVPSPSQLLHDCNTNWLFNAPRLLHSSVSSLRSSIATISTLDICALRRKERKILEQTVCKCACTCLCHGLWQACTKMHNLIYRVYANKTHDLISARKFAF